MFSTWMTLQYMPAQFRNHCLRLFLYKDFMDHTTHCCDILESQSYIFYPCHYFIYSDQSCFLNPRSIQITFSVFVLFLKTYLILKQGKECEESWWVRPGVGQEMYQSLWRWCFLYYFQSSSPFFIPPFGFGGMEVPSGRT